MVKKKKGKSKTIIDGIDFGIMKILSSNKQINVTNLRTKIDLTHANLTTHMKRLEPFTEKKRNKQTINLSINQEGLKMFDLLQRNIPSLKKKRGKR